MLIDIFSHVHTREYLKALTELCPGVKLTAIDPRTSRANILDSKSGKSLGFTKKNSSFDNLEYRIKQINKFGIDMQALAIGTPGIDPALLRIKPKDSVRLAKIVNDSISFMVDRHEDRFFGIAEIPMPESGEAVDELKRAVKDLGMKGAQLYTNVAGNPVDKAQFRPLFSAASKLEVPVLIHPTYPPADRVRSYELDYDLQKVFGWDYETTLAISRLVFSGVLEDNPDLKIISHHAGAMVSFFFGRVESSYRQTGKGSLRDQAKKLKKKPIEYFRMMYHDTAVDGKAAALNCASAVFGASRLIFATDYPYGPDDGAHYVNGSKRAVSRMLASEGEKREIREKNAIRLFKIKV